MRIMSCNWIQVPENWIFYKMATSLSAIADSLVPEDQRQKVDKKVKNFFHTKSCQRLKLVNTRSVALLAGSIGYAKRLTAE